MTELYTIGHSNHASETFLALLRRHAISALADVRSTPYSRRHPQFSRDTLALSLRDSGIAYVFLGAELGGKRPGLSLSAIAATPEFGHGIARLQEGALRWRVAMMCAEREPLDCHRTVLVARHLRSSGLAIRHILADGSVEEHAATERRLVERMHTAPLPLLAHDAEAWEGAVAEAYEARSRGWGEPVLDRSAAPPRS